MCIRDRFNCPLCFERGLRIELSKTGIPFRLYDADKKRKRIAINPNGIFEEMCIRDRPMVTWKV